MAVVGVE